VMVRFAAFVVLPVTFAVAWLLAVTAAFTPDSIEAPVERIVEVPVEKVVYVQVPVEVEKIIEVPFTIPVEVPRLSARGDRLLPQSRSRVMSLMGELEARRRLFLRGADLDALADSDLSRTERSKSLYQSLLVECDGDEGNLAGLLLAVEERYAERINKWHQGVAPAPGCCGDDFDAVVYDLLLRKP